MIRTSLFVGLVWAAVGVGLVRAQHANTRIFTYEPVEGKGGQEVSGPYKVVLNWPEPPGEGWVTDGVAVYAESPDRVYVLGRGIRREYYDRNWNPQTFPTPWSVANLRPVKPLLRPDSPKFDLRVEHVVCVYDRNGKLIESWEQWNSKLPREQADSRIPSVNRIQSSPYDPEHHIWISTGGPLLEFTHDGKTLVRTIDAKDVPQADPNNPSFTAEGVDWFENGDMLVAGGTKVIRFSKEGKYLSEFGAPGTGPGEFGGSTGFRRGIHDVVIDRIRHRIYVADRVNSRIQVFDQNGKYLDMWPNIMAPYCIRLTKDGRYLWVSDGYVMKFQKYDALTGKLVPGSTWGTFGLAPGAFWGIHYFTTDSEGNLYTAEDYGSRVQKFVLRKDAAINPDQVIGELQ